MIKVLFQHFIFEACLEQFFDKLIQNFGWLNWDIKIQSVGDWVRIRVSGLNYDIILTKCIVESKEGNHMILRSEDSPKHIWLEIQDGRIINIYGDESVIIDTFMPSYKKDN